MSQAKSDSAPRSASILDKRILVPAIGGAFTKLNPKTLVKNPVMFVVATVSVLTTVLFLRDLAADVIEAGGTPGIAHSVSAPEGITLPPDALIPLALILAEAIANAIEHGFATRDDGRIAIDLVEVAGHLHLSVVDDGAGLPPAFDLRTSVSLGSKIATTLARQLGGSFEVLNADPVGAMSILVIPHHDQRAPTR